MKHHVFNPLDDTANETALDTIKKNITVIEEATDKIGNDLLPDLNQRLSNIRDGANQLIKLAEEMRASLEVK